MEKHFPINVAESVRQSLSASFRSDGAKCVPMLLIENSNVSNQKDIKAADMALQFYMAHGFVGDRSRMNVHGYPEILRDLQSPPPWVTVEMDDCVGDVSAARRMQLRPLVQQVQDDSDDIILQKFCDDQKQRWSEFKPPIAMDPELRRFSDEVAETDFRNLIALARLLGVELLRELYHALFYEIDGVYEDIIVSAGAPDILVWLPNSDSGFWFFSEVKARGDYLRPSQKSWLNRNWASFVATIW
jgi:VRR-NUC domain